MPTSRLPSSSSPAFSIRSRNSASSSGAHPSRRAYGPPQGEERRSRVSNHEAAVLPFARVVGGFARDGHVVDVALAEARRRDTDEFGAFVELGQGAGAGIAHRGAQAPDQLVQN